MNDQRTRRKRFILILGLALAILSPIMLGLPYGQLDWTAQAQPYETPTAVTQPTATTAPAPEAAPGCSALSQTLVPEGSHSSHV